MTEEQIEDIRQKALRATPGPWMTNVTGLAAGIWGDGDNDGWTSVCRPSLAGKSQWAANSAFISTVNPETILELLSALEAANSNLALITAARDVLMKRAERFEKRINGAISALLPNGCINPSFPQIG